MEQNSSDGLLRLANALSRNSQRELMLFLESASVDDLKLVFPILLNWCLVNYKCEGDDNDRDKNESKNNDTNNVTTGIIAEKIVTILEESIEYETVHDNAEEMKNKNGRISSLRMKLYGFLHTNHEKIQTCSVIRDLGIRTRAKIQADQGATNTLNMVNLCSPPSLAISKDLETEEESNRAPAWEILRIRNIDLGTSLNEKRCVCVCVCVCCILYSLFLLMCIFISNTNNKAWDYSKHLLPIYVKSSFATINLCYIPLRVKKVSTNSKTEVQE